MAYLLEFDHGQPVLLEKFLDGNPIRIIPVGLKFPTFPPDGGQPITFEMADGMPVQPGNVPTKIKLRTEPKPFPDIWMAGGPGKWMVSDKFRALVEQFEPEAHQFFPVEVFDKKDQPVGNSWLFNICYRLDTVDRERSELGETVSPRTGKVGLYSFDYNSTLALNKHAIRGKHLWRDKWLTRATLLSDAFVVAMKAQGITGGKLVKVEEV